ncbi:MAG: GNAT family N-acetyltransferase [Sulfurifustaceae bacterium]
MRRREDYADLIAKGHLEIAEEQDNGNVVGFLVVFIHPDHIMIDTLSIDPAFQGKGAWRWVEKRLAALRRSTGLRVVRTYTNEKLTRNIRLFQLRGFVITGRRQVRGHVFVDMEQVESRHDAAAARRTSRRLGQRAGEDVNG